MSMLLNVRGIGTSKHESAQFAALSLYFLSENQGGQQMYALIKCKLYLVDGLQANILIENDILFSEDFAIHISKNRALIGRYGVIIAINARQHRQFLKQKLLARNNNVIPPCSKSMIPLAPVSLSDDRDFLFYSTTQANLILYAQIVNYTITTILVSNTSDYPLHI